MIALLLDQGLPRRSAADLRDAGWDAVHVGDLGMGAATDEEILDLADREKRVVVTLDGDFARILAARSSTRPSVIHIRIERLGRARATRVLEDVGTALDVELTTGAIATVGPAGTRVRTLPLP